MAKRQSTGKRLRFSVFHRDRFTCQYCGMQPPDAVLVTDHLVPVAEGGETAIDNLVTACEACNQGKADKLLFNRPPTSDADLLWLEAQQEIAEMRRAQQAVAARNAAMAELVGSLQDAWQDITDQDWCPADDLLVNMLGRYSADTVNRAIQVVAPKIRQGKFIQNSSRWVRYMWGVLRNLADATEE